MIGDFHHHIDIDPQDYNISYTLQDVCKQVKKKGITCIAITCHDKPIYTKQCAHIATQYGVLLIPGIEKTVYFTHTPFTRKGKMHLLFYASDNIYIEKIHQLDALTDIIAYKKKHNKNIHCCLAHCKIPKMGLQDSEIEYLVKSGLIDSFEFHGFYSVWWDFPNNKRVVELAKYYTKPLINNTDTHFLEQIGYAKTLFSDAQTPKQVIQALKHTRIVTKPIRTWTFMVLMVKFLYAHYANHIRRLLNQHSRT
ncbi:MAG: PHP domain-containing protein [Candidatus Woesearchaeota archaeon]